MHTKIFRYGSTPMGTFGELELWDDMECVFKCFTVEKPWLNNEPFKSCLPADAYILETHESGRWGSVYAIVGGTVSHYKDEAFRRYTCLFHTANRAEDVVGCIGLGDKLGPIYKDWAVMNSANTVEEYCELLASDGGQHTLEIVWADYTDC